MLLCLILFTKAISGIQAQSLKGYIINNQNDTIRGQVDRPFNEVKSSKKVKFIHINGKVERLSPRSIKGYGDRYDDYLKVTLDLPKGVLGLTKRTSVFMKVLELGKAQLLEYNFNQYASYGFQGPNNLPTSSLEKVNSKYLRFPNGDNLIIDISKIRSGQQIVFTDMPQLIEQLNENTSEAELVRNYNKQIKNKVAIPDSLNDPDKVNIVIFRRQSIIDENRGGLKVRLNSVGSVLLKSGEYSHFTLDKIAYHQLKITNRPKTKGIDFFGRKSHVIYLEMAFGNIVAIKAIDQLKALDHLKSYKEVKAKLKRKKIVYKDWE